MIAHGRLLVCAGRRSMTGGDGSEEVPMAKYLFEVSYTLEGIKAGS